MVIAIAYIPVLHQGYLRFLTSQPIDRLLLLTPETIPNEIRYVKKDIRALTVSDVQKAIVGLNIIPHIEVATAALLSELANTDDRLLFPDEDISRSVISAYLPTAAAQQRVTYSPIFLRWDKKTASEEKSLDTEHKIDAESFVQQMFARAYAEAGKSSDWWRHVGAVATKDGEPLLTAHNKHQPAEQQPYIDGDARALFHAGEQIELTSAIHAEASLIAHAARAGIALERCELYVTTFPCPPCAKLVAASGIKKLYFSEGYGMFDAETILKDANVTIEKVLVDGKVIAQGDSRSTVIHYPV
ncbi:deoxycytidylate deaminase [Candidatus Woesebacteria bacterium]|nr:deoxycytidylate deaminase [Candidatus Woesebacteria bacterium]